MAGNFYLLKLCVKNMENKPKNISSLSIEERKALINKIKNQKNSGLEIQLINEKFDGNEFILSDSQQRIWFAEKIDGVGSAYNIVSALRLAGNLNYSAIAAAINEVVKRHEVLRSSFYERDGLPVQAFKEHSLFELSIIPVNGNVAPQQQKEINEFILAESKKKFDLQNGPLFKVILLKVSEIEHILVSVLHHIVADGWSLEVLETEIAVLYNSFLNNTPANLADLPVQYKDYIYWNKRRLEQALEEKQLAYWKSNLAGAPSFLSFPYDHKRPENRSYGAASRHFVIDRSLVNDLRKLSQANECSLFMLLMASFQLLLSRVTGESDISIGTPSANRTHPKLEKLIGLFSNTLVIRSTISYELNFCEFLAQVKSSFLNAFSNKDVPFERVVDELAPKRSLAYTPLFQVLMVMQNVSRNGMALEGLDISQLEIPRLSTEFDFMVEFFDTPDNLNVNLTYSSELFEFETIDKLIEQFNSILKNIADRPLEKIARLSCLDYKETDDYSSFIKRRDSYENYPDILSRFNQRLKSTPDSVVAADDDASLTFKALDYRSNQLAQYFIEHTGSTGNNIAVAVSPSVDLLVVLLGVIKAGKICVPIYGNAPDKCINAIINENNVSLVVADSRSQSDIKNLGCPVLFIDSEWEMVSAYAGQALPVQIGNGHLVYNYFPAEAKAIVTQVDIAKSIGWMQLNYELQPDDVCLVSKSIDEFNSVEDIFWYLAHAGKIKFSNAIERNSVYSLNEVTVTRVSLSKLPLIAKIDHMRLVLCDVDGFDSITANRNHPLNLRYLYRIPSSLVPVAEGASSERARGSQKHAAFLYKENARLFDVIGFPAAEGMLGELCLHESLPVIAFEKRDYLDIENDIRLIRTGIKAKINHQGFFHSFGAKKSNAIINDKYVDFNTIEKAISEKTGCKEVVVSLRQGSEGTRKVVAYIASDKDFSAYALHSYMEGSFPSFMLPDAYVPIPFIPVDQYGDVDQSALDGVVAPGISIIGEYENELRKIEGVYEIAGVLIEPEVKQLSLSLRNLLPVEKAPANPGYEKESAISDQNQNNKKLSICYGIPSEQPMHFVPKTLSDLLLNSAKCFPHKKIIYIENDGEQTEISYEELCSVAKKVLHGLRAEGLKSKDIAIFQFDKQYDFIVTFWACVLGGIVPVPAPVVQEADPEHNLSQQLLNTWELLDKPAILSGKKAKSILDSIFSNVDLSGKVNVIPVDSIRSDREAEIDNSIMIDDVALMVLTSGSTGKSKAVMLNHSNLVTKCQGCINTNKLTSEDISLNWMPLDHVGGLIMFHLRDVYLGCQQILVMPNNILQDPLLWLKLIDQYRVSTSWAPNFAFGLIVGLQNELINYSFDLSCVRCLINGGEAVVAKTVRQYLKILSTYNISSECIHPAYGMSETSSAITYSRRFNLADTTDFDVHVSVGEPIAGVTLRIVDDNNITLPEGEIGRLHVKGDTITAGYYNAPDKTQEAFTSDGWFITGDLAFLKDGQLTITGREKEILIINGTNISNHHVESPIEDIPGVRKSFTAACAHREHDDDTDKLLIFFSPETDDAETNQKLIEEIQMRLQKQLGFSPAYVLPLPANDIPKTSLGKIKRKTLLANFIEGRYNAVISKFNFQAESRKTIPDWFYKKSWKRKPIGRKCDLNVYEGIVIFHDSQGLGKSIVNLIDHNASGKVIQVSRGDSYAKKHNDHYQISPERQDDYESLFDSIKGYGFKSINILHLWTYDSDHQIYSENNINESLTCGLYSLFFLSNTIDRHFKQNEHIRFTVVSSCSQNFAKENIDAGKAAIHGFIKTMSQESTRISCAHIDFSDNKHYENHAGIICDEIKHGADDAIVYRNGVRWISCLEKTKFPAKAKNNLPALKKGGFYILIGGLGGIGQCLAKLLLEKYYADVLILGRSHVSLQANEPPEKDKGKAEALKKLQLLPGNVKYQSLDVANFQELREVIDKSSMIFGKALNGIFNLSGQFHEKLINEESYEGLRNSLHAKVFGALGIHHALQDHPDVFLVNFSSINAYFGGYGVGAYSAANSFIEGLTSNEVEKGRRAYCLSWSLWKNIGMSEEIHNKELSYKRGYCEISAEDGLNSMVAILNHSVGSHIIGLNGNKKFIKNKLKYFAEPEQAISFYYTAEKDIDFSLGSRINDIFGKYIDTNFIRIESIPKNENGEISRERLIAYADTKHHADSQNNRPRNAIEETLLDIWKVVLSNQDININDNFFRFGGDSILCTQMIARANQKGIYVTNKQLFENQTIQKLARVASEKIHKVADQSVVTGDVSLAPIQAWFFSHNFTSESQWNQSVLLKTDYEVNVDILRQALSALTLHHDALRLRFAISEEGKVHQFYADIGEEIQLDVYDLTPIHIDEQITHMERKMELVQEGLDLTKGPLLKAALFSLSEPHLQGQRKGVRLFLAVHHLVVDGVSWRILLEDLNTLVSQLSAGSKHQLPGKTISYKQWTDSIRSPEQIAYFRKDLPYWAAIGKSEFSLPVKSGNVGRVGSEKSIQVSLDSEETSKLLQDISWAYSTKINDLLLTALAMAFHDWIGANDVLISLEGHGREELIDGIDISRTVGWFTSIFPVQLSLPDFITPGESIKAIKEQLAGIPNKGVSYGVLKYISGDLAEHHIKPPISFNYLGQFSEDHSNNTYRFANEKVVASQHKNERRVNLIDIVCITIDGQMRFSWTYSDELFTDESISEVANLYVQHLKKIIDHCYYKKVKTFTPSDFPLLTHSQQELDRLVTNLNKIDISTEKIVDILPLTPTQYGMLYHSFIAADSGIYVSHLVNQIRGDLNVEIFHRAWQAVVDKYDIFRTVFVDLDKDKPVQVIQDAATINFKALDWSNVNEEQQELSFDQLVSDDKRTGFQFDKAPLLRIYVVKLNEYTHRILLSEHHALSDGWSRVLILNDVFKSYQYIASDKQVNLDPPIPFSNYLQWYQQQDMDAAAKFWAENLKGLENICKLAIGNYSSAAISHNAPITVNYVLSREISDKLRSFSTNAQLTLNLVVQGAWAILISHYCGQDDVIFGITTSNRPVDLPNVEEIAGPFLNTLPFRVQLDPDLTPQNWLHYIQSCQIGVSQYNHTSLRDIQKWSGLSASEALFQSLLIFENFPDTGSVDEDGELFLDWSTSEDHTETPIVLMISPEDKIRFTLSYIESVLPEKWVNLFLENLEHILTSFLERPTQNLKGIRSALNPKIKKIRNDWNIRENIDIKTGDFPNCLASYADSKPEAIAISGGNEALTYFSLDRKVNQLMHQLRANGITPLDKVAVCLTQSSLAMISALAIFRTGAIYIPIDASIPSDKTSGILENVRPNLVLTDNHNRRKFDLLNVDILSLDDQWQVITAGQNEHKRAVIDPESDAYWICDGENFNDINVGTYESLNRMSHSIQPFEITSDSRVLQYSLLNSDAAIWELVSTFTAGATLFLAEANIHTDIEMLESELIAKKITHVSLPPAILASVSTQALESVVAISNNRQNYSVSKKLQTESFEESYLQQIRETMVDIWSRVLGKQVVNIKDNFFDLGGDSINTIQLVSRSREAGLIFSAQDIYHYPTIEMLSIVASFSKGNLTEADHDADVYSVEEPTTFAYISSEQLKNTGADSVLEQMENVKVVYPVFPLQRSFIHASVLHDNKQYGVSQLTFELSGNIDIPRVKDAWQKIINNYEALRTVFIETNKAGLLQVVLASASLPWHEYDLTELPGETYEEKLKAILSQERKGGFSAVEAPLLKVGLVYLPDDCYWMILSYHHAILDGWSLPILFQELFNNYQGQYQAGTPIKNRGSNKSYFKWLASLNKTDAREYWSAYLKDYREPAILHITRNNTSGSNKPNYGKLSSFISEEVTGKLTSFARRERITLNTLMQSAFGILLGRYSASNDIVFGTTVSGRSAEVNEVDSLVGMFINSIPLRIKLSPSVTVSELLKEVHSTQTVREKYSYLSIDEIALQSELPPGHSLFDATLTFENYPLDQVVSSAIESLDFNADFIDQTEENNFTLAMVVVLGDALEITVRYNEDQFSATSISSFIHHFEMLLEQLMDCTNDRVFDLQVYSAVEYQKLLDLSAGQLSLSEEYETINELFNSQASITPNAIAIVDGTNTLTYLELNARANKMANYLIQQGVGIESAIAVGMERSIELIVSMLAVFKAGAVYVPIDPVYPVERQKYMLETVNASLLITKSTWQCFNGQEVTKLYIDLSWDLISTFSDKQPECAISPTNLAYIIFTSGSTGLPKASEIFHSSLCNIVQCQYERFGIGPGDRLAQVISVSFDVSVQETLMGICSGATLYVIPQETVFDIEKLHRTLTDNEINAMHFTNSLLDNLISKPLPDLRVVITGGEPISAKIVSNYSTPQRKLFNEYGTTEITLAVVSHYCEEVEDNPPIGKPYEGTQILVLDKNLNIVPVGAIGELYIGGTGVSRGYRNRMGLTAEKFLPNPYSVLGGERLYKTGDLAVYQPDKSIKFIGRADHQVKIRGHRVELNEIENIIVRYPGVNSVIAAVKDDMQQQKRIAVYLITDHGHEEIKLSELREWLKNKLPTYMLPSSLNKLDQFPLTLSGKVDRMKLPEPNWDADGVELDLSGLTDVENSLLDIVSEVVGITKHQSQMKENFFDLGGDSLSAGQVISRINQIFNINLGVVSIFESASIHELAKLVDEERAVALDGDIDDLLGLLEGMTEEQAKEMLEHE